MFCDGCGRPIAECDGSCKRELDPPRFCTECGRKLAVRVTPMGFVAECKKHPFGDVKARS